MLAEARQARLSPKVTCELDIAWKAWQENGLLMQGMQHACHASQSYC